MNRSRLLSETSFQLAVFAVSASMMFAPAVQADTAEDQPHPDFSFSLEADLSEESLESLEPGVLSELMEITDSETRVPVTSSASPYISVANRVAYLINNSDMARVVTVSICLAGVIPQCGSRNVQIRARSTIQLGSTCYVPALMRECTGTYNYRITAIH